MGRYLDGSVQSGLLCLRVCAAADRGAGSQLGGRVLQAAGSPLQDAAGQG